MENEGRVEGCEEEWRKGRNGERREGGWICRGMEKREELENEGRLISGMGKEKKEKETWRTEGG